MITISSAGLASPPVMDHNYLGRDLDLSHFINVLNELWLGMNGGFNKYHQDFCGFFWVIRKVARQFRLVVHCNTSAGIPFKTKIKMSGRQWGLFLILFCILHFSQKFRLFCDNPCYSNINPGAFDNISTLSGKSHIDREQIYLILISKNLCLAQKMWRLLVTDWELRMETFVWILLLDPKPNKPENCRAWPGPLNKMMVEVEEPGVERWVIKLIMPVGTTHTDHRGYSSHF